MGKVTRIGLLGTLVVAGTLAFTAGVAMGAPPSSSTATAYTCSGGSFPNDVIDIPSGHYASLTVAGACDVPDKALVNVDGNINVLTGAVLDAQSAPSTITVGHNVTAADGSILGLGCQPNSTHSEHPCATDPTGSSVVTIGGNLTTTNAAAFLLNGITVDGNITITGGGQNFIPDTVKNNTIGKNLTISGVVTDWIGVLFNSIAGNATLTNITLTDPSDSLPTMQIAVNTVGKNLNCSGIGPNLSGGFIPGEVNTVGGQATGQCYNLQAGG